VSEVPPAAPAEIQPERPVGRYEWLPEWAFYCGSITFLALEFIFPACVVTGVLRPTLLTVISAALLYLMLWANISVYLMRAARHLYGLEDKWILPFYGGSTPSQLALVWRKGVVVLILRSFVFAIYAYSLTYVAISRWQSYSFNVGPLTLPTATYFSIVTIATAGYGDIYPTSGLARAAVCTEILFSLSFGVFIFSLIASFIKREDKL